MRDGAVAYEDGLIFPVRTFYLYLFLPSSNLSLIFFFFQPSSLHSFFSFLAFFFGVCVDFPHSRACRRSTALPLDSKGGVDSGASKVAVSDVVTLPQSFGSIFLGETFTSYVIAHNESREKVTNIVVKAELQMKSAVRGSVYLHFPFPILKYIFQ